jgi:uncharacterized membrane protein HdeD (DUF308 family)
MKGFRNTLVVRGVLALAVGVIAVVWPGITIGAFVILFALYAFLSAGMQTTLAFRSDAAGPRTGRLLLALLDVASGIVALAWPSITALALVWLVAVWAFITGLYEIMLAFSAGETAGERALLSLTGMVSVALGVVFSIRPDIGAVTLAQVYGLFSIISGVSALVLATTLHSAQNNHLFGRT